MILWVVYIGLLSLSSGGQVRLAIDTIHGMSHYVAQLNLVGLLAPPDHPRIAVEIRGASMHVNLSVRESIDDLLAFTHQTKHLAWGAV